MGFWNWLTGKKPAPFAPQRAVPPRGEASAPVRRKTVDQLAREMLAEYPNRIDGRVLWGRCEQEGLEMSAVDRRMDELRYAAAEVAQHSGDVEAVEGA